MMSNTINNQMTYVYEGSEVALTGRKAERRIAPSRRKPTNTNNVEILIEIHPASDPSAWLRWVKMSELYTIITKETNDNE